MFRLRRRNVAATAASDLPFCAMCGQAIRVDAATGRCALGHRVTALSIPAPVETVAVAEPAADTVAAFDTTELLPGEAADVTAELGDVEAHPTAAHVGEGLYEAYSSADAAGGRTVTWDDVVAPTNEPSAVYDDYLGWNEPAGGFSSLDVDTAELPAAPERTPSAPFPPAPDAAADEPLPPTITPVSGDLLDELDDAAYARRKALGTIGGTIAVGGAIFGSIAVLPF